MATGYDDPLDRRTGVERIVRVFGGESPAWPPALLAPQRVVDSTTGMWQYVTETNTGGDRHESDQRRQCMLVERRTRAQWDARFRDALVHQWDHMGIEHDADD